MVIGIDMISTFLKFASEKFLGDQKASYNQELTFKLRMGEEGGSPGQDDLVIISGGDRPSKISVSLIDQNNPPPDRQVICKKTYKNFANLEWMSHS